MANKAKIKGSNFEREVVAILNNIKGTAWKRVPMSGAIGTLMSEPQLGGDLHGKVYGIPKGITGECKDGYNTSSDKEVKSLSLKKEWLDKVAIEAENAMEIPIFFGKFDNVRSGVKIFTVMDIKIFMYLLQQIVDLKLKLDEGNEDN
jgi:hypothetical protein